MTRSNDDRPAKPLLKDAGQARAERREARQAAALRANLQRRKMHDRARQDEGEAAPKTGSDAPPSIRRSEPR